MYGIIVFIVVAVLAYVAVRVFSIVRRFDSKEDFLKYYEEREKVLKKEKEEEREAEPLLEEEEEEWDDDFIDKKSFDFLFLGAVATILFLICGLFTGNSFYFILVLFIITTMLYLYFYPPKGNF